MKSIRNTLMISLTSALCVMTFAPQNASAAGIIVLAAPVELTIAGGALVLTTAASAKGSSEPAPGKGRGEGQRSGGSKGSDSGNSRPPQSGGTPHLDEGGSSGGYAGPHLDENGGRGGDGGSSLFKTGAMAVGALVLDGDNQDASKNADVIVVKDALAQYVALGLFSTAEQDAILNELTAKIMATPEKRLLVNVEVIQVAYEKAKEAGLSDTDTYKVIVLSFAKVNDVSIPAARFLVQPELQQLAPQQRENVDAPQQSNI